MDARMYLLAFTFLSFFLYTNTAPIQSEITEEFPLERECLYQTQYYSHGSSIETEEPCLNCTCNKGVLVCFLRVCHNLVARPDSGCEVRKTEGQCCAELFCGAKNLSGIVGNTTQSADVTTPTPRLSDQPFTWTSTERASEDTTLSPTEFTVHDNAVNSGCRLNGSIYAEGSAMPSSTFCEYCYCIKGHQRCITPQCHLHIDECKPIYRHDFSCCPTAYSCSKRTTTTQSTTTVNSLRKLKQQDCHVNGTTYKEGEVVVNEDLCQNCFCVKGEVHCSTTKCALITTGCEPLFHPGKCCPTGYNCKAVPSTREEPQEQDNSLTGSTTEGALQQSPITSYFDNIISSTDSSITESQETAYESSTFMDTLLSNDTDTENDTIAARDNDRNILEADALLTTTVAVEDASLEASEIVSSTPESNESNELKGTSVREDEIASLISKIDSKHNLQATTDQPAETEDPLSSSPSAAEEPIISNYTNDIAADADVNTTLSEIPQSLNQSVEDSQRNFNDTILQSKAAVTDSIQPAVNESFSGAETNSSEEYVFKNASEAVTSFSDVDSHINTTEVIANDTASVDGKVDEFASNSSDSKVNANPEINSSGNFTANVTIDSNDVNEASILEDRSDYNILTTETADFEETTIQNWNSSSINGTSDVINSDDSINNHSIIHQTTDINDNVTRIHESDENEIGVRNALFGGIHNGINTTANINKIINRNDTKVPEVEVLELATIRTDTYSNNETQFDSKNTTEAFANLHQLHDAVQSAEHKNSNLTRLSEDLTDYDVQENQTFTNSSKSANLTADESLTISENETQSLDDVTSLHLTQNKPLNIHINNSDAEESNITAAFVEKVANEAMYRQAVKTSSNSSSFEDEGIPAVQHFANGNKHLTNLNKTTATDKPSSNIQVTKDPSDQLQDPYVAQASNETLIYKPGPMPSNNTNVLLGSFSSIVSSLLKQEDNGSSTTAQSVKEAELIHSKLPESFDVLLEDLVGEYPGEVQFNTISYLNFNNDVATLSTAGVSQDSTTPSPDSPQAILFNETQLIGKNESLTIVNGSHEAPNQLHEQSDFVLTNLTVEDQLRVQNPDKKNDSEINENTSKQQDNTTASQTTSDTDEDLNVNENKTELLNNNQSSVEETTSSDIDNKTDIPPHFFQLNKTYGRNPDEENNVTKFDDETTAESATETSKQNISLFNVSTEQPVPHPTEVSTSLLFTTVDSNIFQSTSTQLSTNNAEENSSFHSIPISQESYSNLTTELHHSNETLQTANDSFTQDISTTLSPPKTETSVATSLDAGASATLRPHEADEQTTVKSLHDVDQTKLANTSSSQEEQHQNTGNNEMSLETSTIVDDLDDTLEMILNLSKTYANTHPHPSSFGSFQNKTDEDLMSGTLPSEVEAKIAEIIRQAQAGLINGGNPSLHLNHTIPHFSYEENDRRNSTAENNRNQTGDSNLSSSIDDYEYDDSHGSHAAETQAPNEFLAQIGGLLNSSWSSQISGDVHRDAMQELPGVSEKTQENTPSNESIMQDLHQMFIPLVDLSKKFNSTDAVSTDYSAFVTAIDDHKSHDVSTPDTSSPRASTIPSEVDIEITTYFPRDSIKEVNSQDGESINAEPIGAAAIGGSASTEASTHFVQDQLETDALEHNVHGSDQWQNHDDSQDGGSHFAHGNEDHAPSFEGVQGHSDNEDVFSHAVAADDDEKSYFGNDDFETGANRHEVENSGEVSAADSKLSVDDIHIKEDSEHNDALLESTHLEDSQSSISDWQDEQNKPEQQPQNDEIFETVPQTTSDSSTTVIRKTTTEVQQHFPTNNHNTESLSHEEIETPVTASAETIAEEHTADTITDPITKPEILQVLNRTTIAVETWNTEATTQSITTKTIHDTTKIEDATDAAETEKPHKGESAIDDAWSDLGGDGTSRLEKRSTTEYPSTTVRNIPRDPATNFFSTLSNFFSQAIANAGLNKDDNKHVQNKADSPGVLESNSHQPTSGSHHSHHQSTNIENTKPAEDHDFPETGFLRKDAENPGHHSLITETSPTENANAQHHYADVQAQQPTQESNQQPSENIPLLHSFVEPDPQGDQEHHISGEHASGVYQSAFVASETITTPDPNAFVGLVSKGSIVFEHVLPLSRRGRPTTDERTGQALPTPRKSSGIDNGSTEESALVPEDVRVIPFLPEDAITDELHQEPVKPNLAPRNEDKDAIVEPITRNPQTQDVGSMDVRVSAISSFQVDDAAEHEETGSVGVAVPISPEDEEFVPMTVATMMSTTTLTPTESSHDYHDNSMATATPQPSSTVTEERTVSTSTLQNTESTTSSTSNPKTLSADVVSKDGDQIAEHHMTESALEDTPRTQSTRTNKNDDQGVFNMQSAPSFQQTPDYCVEEGEVFQDGERIPTADFCAQCRCNRGEIQCQHVSCPQRPPGCIEKVMPSSCCPSFLCNETGLIQDEESGLPLRSGITIHGGFVPIERPVGPHEQHVPAFEGTQSHAEVPSSDNTHGPEHSQSHHGTDVTEAIGHVFGSEEHGHDTALAEQTVAPVTPPMQQDPHPSPVNDEPPRGTTTENSGLFGGIFESVFGSKETEHSPEGTDGEDTVAETKEPESIPEVHDAETTRLDVEQEVVLTTSTSGPTTTKLASRRTTKHSPPTEGTSTKAPETQPGLWPMLKVSSCNIYGRVYQVGSKIGVLSGPCKECKCTSGGVECYRIKCF